MANGSQESDELDTQKLGGFELLGRLGKGAMGTVLKARQVSMDRLVALKVLPQTLAKDEHFVQRFLREARSAARLRHPNIVQAFDAGCVEGHYFFAMEFVDGETLETIVRRDGPLEPNRALHIMKEVASALAAAHEEGIVHRDIKPPNIMVDKKGEVRVTDFGLAKRTEGDVEATAYGAIVGTPTYFAPETAKGGEADHRSDLYSLGATIFCALAGCPPFEGKTFAEVIAKKVTEDAPPLATLAPRVDDRFCHIIDRLLRRDPDARPPSAAALLTELEGLGPLRSVGDAARAEAHAMLREAPTLEMTEGKRLERAAAQARLADPPRAGRKRLVLAAAAAGLALLAALTLPRLLWPARPGAKMGPGAELREQNAQAIFHNATAAARDRDWAAARRYLDDLASDYADTEFFAAKRAAIEALRQKAEAPPPETPPEPPPKQEPREVPPEPQLEGGGVSLFDGRTLDGWKAVERFQAGILGAGDGRPGEVRVEDGRMVLDKGNQVTGVSWTREFPSEQYEVALEAVRVDGINECASIVFPVGDQWCRLAVGAGRGVVTLACVDGQGVHDAANVASRPFRVMSGRWYKIRLRVSRASVEAWIDETKLVDLPREGHLLTLDAWAAPLRPFGVMTWGAMGALRNIQLRRLKPEPPEEAAGLECRLLATLAGHANWVTHAAFSPDGTRVATSSRDRTLKLWDAATGRDLRTFQGHTDGVEGVAFSPDGQRLASVSYDGTVRLWEVNTARCLATLDHQRVPLHAVVFLADGKSVLSGSEDGRIRLWDIAAEKCIKTMADPVGRMQVQSLSLSQDGKRLLSGGKDSSIRLWDLQTGASLRTQPALSPQVWCVGLSPDGLRMLSVGDENAVRVWSADTGALLKVLPTPSPNRGVSFSPDGRWIAASAWQGWLHVWDAATYERLVSVRGHQRDIFKHAFSADSKRLATAGFDHVAKVWELVPPGPAVEKPLAKAGEWVSLFDGQTLDGWRVAEGTWFGGHGRVAVQDGRIVLEAGANHTGIATTRDVPTGDYEVRLEGMRVAGDADFCNIVLPVGVSHCGVLVGGFGGRVVTLHSLDGIEGPGNPTTKLMDFERGRWYRVRVRVTRAKVEAWIDDQRVIAVERAGHQFPLWYGHLPLKPLGIEAVKTTAALRSIEVRRLVPEAAAPPPEPPPKPLALPPGGQWLPLFDGKTLVGWRVVPFFPGPRGGRGGRAEVRDGHIVLETGMPRTAIAWTGGFPTTDYEVRVEAARILGGSDFCAIVFPLGAAHCSWVVGGYGGATSGLEALDNTEAHFNETTRRLAFQQGQWYQVLLRVTKARIEGWIDDEKVFDTLTAGHTFALRDFAQPVAPFGICTWNTAAGLRSISVRAITPGPEEGPPPDEPPPGAKPVEAAMLAVAAHTNWFDSGLYVTGGKAYELAASGTWGTDPPSPACGPEGMLYHAAVRFPLPGMTRKFSLIGRVGVLGRPFRVGEKLALTPETTGRLYLRMNDPVAWDNWGSLRVTVAGPLLADADAPLLGRFTKELRKLNLDAKSDWTDAGVAAQPGDRILIAAAGTWQAGPLVPPANADGYQEALAFLRRGALVGRIGEEGRPFHVGQLLLLEATKAGKLYLAMNDDAREDNQGMLTVTISAPPAAPGPLRAGPDG